MDPKVTIMVTTIEGFIKKMIWDQERTMMKKWLESEIQSYNFFKSINYELW